MTTKLIQELVGLAVERGVSFSFDEDDLRLFVIWHKARNVYLLSIYTNESGAPDQLQAAIDKIKRL